MGVTSLTNRALIPPMKHLIAHYTLIPYIRLFPYCGLVVRTYSTVCLSKKLRDFESPDVTQSRQTHSTKQGYVLGSLILLNLRIISFKNPQQDTEASWILVNPRCEKQRSTLHLQATAASYLTLLSSSHIQSSPTLYIVLVAKSNYRNINIVLIVSTWAYDSNMHFKRWQVFPILE
jgi:hypothetical protein